MLPDGPAPQTASRVVALAAMAGLLLLSYAVLAPFVTALAWAAVLAYVTWPAYERLRRLLNYRDNSAALLMTLATAAALVLPFVWAAFMLQTETADIYGRLAAWLAGKPEVPPFVRGLPLAGPWLDAQLASLLADPASIRALVSSHADQGLALAGTLVGDLGRNLAKFGIALFSLFFLYRDGVSMVDQIHTVSARFLGERARHYLAAVGATTRAVVLGLVLTALAQGTLAGLGYWVAGLSSPVTLAVITAVIAFIPFGTPVVWGAAALWLFATGDTWAGLGLALWGALVVSWVDNLIRPLVISSQVSLSFLLVFLGVLGGLAAFGLIGLFLGPVILAVLAAVWREWLGEQLDSGTPPPRE